MYLVIKRESSEDIKHKVHEMKELACDILKCLEEAYSEGHESETRERGYKEDRYDSRRRHENYDDYDDYDREEPRSRNMRKRY